MKIGGLPTRCPCPVPAAQDDAAAVSSIARPKKYWVLKGFHAHAAQALFETYPDAQHHLGAPGSGAGDRLAHRAHRRNWSRRWPGTVDWKEQARVASGREPRGLQGHPEQPAWSNDPRIHHVRYPDFVADPVGTIRGFYEKAVCRSVPTPKQAHARLSAEQQGDRYGKFRYSTDALGADIDACTREFEPYRRALRAGHRATSESGSFDGFRRLSR